LRTVDKLIEGDQRKALDLGAGTGNLTDKLLRMGYEVTAIDISKEMCEILEKKYTNSFENGKLMVVHSTIEDASFDRDELDLIACYSVLHHLPDYLHVLQKLCGLLKKGGIMYLDHENAPFGCSEPTHRIRSVYLRSEWFLDHLYYKITGLEIPSFDYTLADWWTAKEHQIDHRKIARIFEKEEFRFVTRIDYHQKRGWFFNPFFDIYKHICKPDACLWLAKK
jgi:2-polyprenyl-3-methyl-5-hydroxy-6-metoxy-1,4-benzoquinol methylase